MQANGEFLRVEEANHTFLVNRASMARDDIFRAEHERIFEKCWLYLGHNTEIPKPGDFVTRTVAGRPMIFCRDRDEQVHAFLNACTHRGAQVCREDRGNESRFFRCFYHGWTFATNGDLVGVPDDAAYPPDRRETLPGLASPPGVDSYRGFVFVRFTDEGPSLSEYLAGTKEYLDYISDKSESGIEVIEGSHRYTMRANWKLLMENSFDGYHPASTHQTYVRAVKELGDALENPTDGSTFRRQGGPARAYDLGNGHCVTAGPSVFGRPVARWAPGLGEETRSEIERRYERLVEVHGKERADRIANWDFNMLIFPNLFIIDFLGLVVRTVEPVATDATAITAWMMGVQGEDPAMRQASIRSALSFFGPGGMATPDDVEALESCQRGFGSVTEHQWSDLSRGFHKPLEEQTNKDEMQLRRFWTEWDSLLWADKETAAHG